MGLQQEVEDMEITITQDQGPSPVTIMHLQGKLDGSNYETLVAEAQKQYDSGVRNLLLDFSQLTFLSSAGLAALHTVALLFRGQKASERQEGWAAFRAMDRDRESGQQPHVKLFNPNPDVQRILETVGFNAFFEIYNNIHQAVGSFQ
jgi:anti-anti-sigma factor